MAWQGKIVEFQHNADYFKIGLIYYNDVSPAVGFPRTIKLPLNATKAQAVAAIQARGAEVRAMAKLNDENFVGQIIPIP